MFYYVYILRSEIVPTCHFTGFTTNLEERLKQPDSGGVLPFHCLTPVRETSIPFVRR